MYHEGEYRKSSYSGAGGCVEVAPVAGGVKVRDSKDSENNTLFFTNTEWVAFLRGVRHGEFDVDDD